MARFIDTKGPGLNVESFRTIVPLALVCIGISSCSISTGIRQYTAFENSAINESDVAVLHVPTTIKVGKINGEGRYYPLLDTLTNPYRGAQIKLEPGHHRIELNYHLDGYHSSDQPTVMRISVEAGNEYEIKPVLSQVEFRIIVTYELLSRT